MTAAPEQIDVLDEAREQVLERGVGLSEAQVLTVLELPEDRIPELLALAHEVRERWCGPEVEVEGIVSLKTGGCPEDCHFCSQSGLFTSPVGLICATASRACSSVCEKPRSKLKSVRAEETQGKLQPMRRL